MTSLTTGGRGACRVRMFRDFFLATLKSKDNAVELGSSIFAESGSREHKRIRETTTKHILVNLKVATVER